MRPLGSSSASRSLQQQRFFMSLHSNHLQMFKNPRCMRSMRQQQQQQQQWTADGRWAAPRLIAFHLHFLEVPPIFFASQPRHTCNALPSRPTVVEFCPARPFGLWAVAAFGGPWSSQAGHRTGVPNKRNPPRRAIAWERRRISRCKTFKSLPLFGTRLD